LPLITNSPLLSLTFNSGKKNVKLAETALHTAVAPAGRAAVKTDLSHQNDTIIVLFLTANTNKDDVKGPLAVSNI